MRNSRNYVSGHELYCCMALLSVLHGIFCFHTSCKLVKACVLQFSVCIFQSIIFHSTIGKNNFQVLVPKRYYIKENRCRNGQSIILQPVFAKKTQRQVFIFQISLKLEKVQKICYNENTYKLKRNVKI